MDDIQAEVDVSNIEPCPFCGNDKPELVQCPSHYVQCRKCDADGPWNDEDAQQALDEWNKRPLTTSIPRELGFAIRELLGSLPERHDWLKPEIEKILRRHDATHRVQASAAENEDAQE
jgi:hypothetical protein